MFIYKGRGRDQIDGGLPKAFEDFGGIFLLQEGDLASSLVMHDVHPENPS